MRKIGWNSIIKLLQSTVLVGLLCPWTGASAQQDTVRLWPSAAPGSGNWTQKEVRFVAQFGGETIRNVVEPTLSVFLPPPATAIRTAVIVCPGGAFQALSWNAEGTDVATWLNKQGVAALVLKYRLANTGETDAEFRGKLAVIQLNFTFTQGRPWLRDEEARPSN